MEARLSRFHSLNKLQDMSLEAARLLNDEEAAVMFGPVEHVLKVDEGHLPGPGGDIPIRIYRPSADERLPTLVYLHGGGWVVGSLESHDGVARFLASHARCLVVAVDYRLAPEHRFPAALEDAWAATAWARDHAIEIGGDPSRLAVGGDSAGGNLAAVVACHARNRGVELVFQLLVYPVLDCLLTAADEESGWWVRQYLGAAPAHDPDSSPLLASDLRGVAPALILSCALDPLRDQGGAYLQRLLSAGVRADHIVYPGLMHGAYRMPGVVPPARRMLEDSAAALVKAFGPQLAAI